MSENIKTFPIEGGRLREVVVEGRGKDGVLSLVPVEGHPMRFPLSAPNVTLELSGEVTTHVGSVGDTDLRLRFTAPTLTAVRARVDYPGDDAEWAEQIEQCDSRNCLDLVLGPWAIARVDLKLRGTA